MIIMGNDEFILYIRKRYPNCSIPNNTLGKLIWARVQLLDSHAESLEDDDCYWGKRGNFINTVRLPKSAEQFQFHRSILPEIYNYLDEIGRG